MKLLISILLPVFCLGASHEPPTDPQGPEGTVLRYNLLDPLPGGRLGAFNTRDWEPGHVNDEVQYYKPENAVQEQDGGEIVITAEKRPDGKIYSARLESYQVWTTPQSEDIKKRGYIEVRALYPSKVNGETLKGAWPAIWMLGSGNGYEWPRHGEIDMMEARNGSPKIYMATHSTNHNGGNSQHPSAYAYEVNADFTQDQLICGFEWNLENQGQIDLTWWMTWYDLGSQNWKSEHSTLVLQQWNDYWDFYNSFNGEGFSVLINLAEGGNFPGTSDALIDGQPQLLVVKSAKVYGF